MELAQCFLSVKYATKLAAGKQLSKDYLLTIVNLWGTLSYVQNNCLKKMVLKYLCYPRSANEIYQ